MRPWIKHWLDWVTTDVLPLPRTRPYGLAVYTRYEKAGLTLYDTPVPWNADEVVVEALLRLPPAARKRGDFHLLFPGREPVPAESLRQEVEDRHRLLFRLPPPAASCTGEVRWKGRPLATVAVPVLTADEFRAGLQIGLPTVSVRLGGHTVAARAFVASQCKGIVASAVLRSPTPLAPLAEMGAHVFFRNERTGAAYTVPIQLSSSQLAAREAVVAVCPPRHPRRVGAWTVGWWVGGREVQGHRVEAIPARRFEASLRVCDTRFVNGDKTGVRVARQPAPPAEGARIGPCFLVASTEPGMAGVCRLEVFAVAPGADRQQPLLEQEVLISDGPAVFAPGLLEASELGRVSGFELRHKSRTLGVASLSPVPTAVLTAEGGFKPPPEFTWSNVAEDELADRLGRLMGGGPPG